MHSAAKAYGMVAQQIANPRELEARLLLKAAARLQQLADGWDGDIQSFKDALLYNRKLWTVFLTSVTAPDHPMPAAIRQNIANLGLFIMTRTVELAQNPNVDQLPPLVSINREIAAGLMSQP